MMEQLVPKLRFPEFKDDWKKNELKSVVTINPKVKQLPEEFIYIDLESVEKGTLLFEKKIKKEDAPSRATRTLETDDILFQTVRPYQRNNYLFTKTEKNYVASTGYAQLRTKHIPKFIYQILSIDNFNIDVMNRCTGTSYPAINSTDLGNIKISYPTLQEQTKIADFLGAVDKQLDILNQKKEKLNTYKKGVMQQLFSKQLRFKDDNGNDFPEWEEKTLGHVLKYTQPNKFIVKSTDYNNNYTTPVLTAGKSFLLGFTNESENIYKDIPCIIFDDFTTSSQFVDFEFKVKSSAMKILNTIGNDNIKFLFELIKTIQFPTGDEHKRYWISEYSQIKLFIPSIAEQTKIANFLSAIDRQIETVSAQIQKTENYKKGLLQQMFV